MAKHMGWLPLGYLEIDPPLQNITPHPSAFPNSSSTSLISTQILQKKPLNFLLQQEYFRESYGLFQEHPNLGAEAGGLGCRHLSNGSDGHQQ